MQHRSLREHLLARAERGQDVEFEPTDDETLRGFARIFAGLDSYSFDVNKHLPEDELAPMYELTSERVRSPGSAAEVLTRHWAPVTAGDDPITGFHTGLDSSVWGGSPADFMPPDENTAAFLLLVTSTYVHLSASREQDPPLVRGAISESGEQFRFVELSTGQGQA